MSGSNSTRVILTLLPLTRCWEHARLSLNFIFGTNYYAIWFTFVFLRVSVQICFGKLTTIGWKDILAWKILWQCYTSIYIGQNFVRTSANISGPSLPAPLTNQPLRNTTCTTLFLLSTGHGNPYQWTKCQAFLHPSR
jgi:hypothetical protein